MATDARWRRIDWPALLVLALAAGTATAEETEEAPAEEGGEEVVYIDELIYEEGSEGGDEVVYEDVVYDDGASGGEEVVYIEEEYVPVDSSCDGCEAEGVVTHYSGEQVPEPVAVSASPGRSNAARDSDGDEWRFGRSPPSSNACFVPELYVAWLCEGYPKP